MEIFSKDSKRGFTLIELLVVIAIIGLLASIILVSLGGARNKAKDARIINNMSQMRTQAAIISYNTGSYNTIRCGAAGDINIRTLCGDIADQGGRKPWNDEPGLQIVRSPSPVDRYCAKVKLNSGKFWCVDYELRSTGYDANPSCKGGASPIYTCE